MSKELNLKIGGGEQGWEGKEPAPLEFFHDEVMNMFHKWRTDNALGTEVVIDGRILNMFVTKAKVETYKKYPKQINRLPVPTAEL